ncbi:unnamed protein product [Phytophthora lilii]|uniref:Unnamed protein product n=1 Tax=Phytophthora lilii TaxID=2077276 RepID=A0A9W6YJI5_9STRA|nr:unnamed protein product [Phytophthora lilii]
MLHQLRSSTATIPFKLKAPSRQQLVVWTKAAWDSLSTEVVKSGFAKANIMNKQGEHADATIQDLFDAEPDWNLFSRLLDEVPVVRHFVDPARDIDTLAEDEGESES